MTRKRTTLRRGSFVAEIALLVPLIAATLTIIFQVSVRSMRLQAQAVHALAADAQRDDLLRRMRDDAAAARSASLESTADAATLTLSAVLSPSGSPEAGGAAESRVEYRVDGSRVVRVEQPTDGPPTVYEWNLENLGVRLNLEAIAEQPRIVWVSFVPRPREEDGERCPGWTLATAVTINRGGTQ